ncbi:LysR family transcriptional regulator, partial [bacterium]|nr:LysR family transcriptional regulator [bacterium]MBU1026076.1 LysR family transcriptional regulator [bacterium]
MSKIDHENFPDPCNILDFNFKQCETFCKVAELGSFSKAAEELNITQASASERVANLEKMIGVKLLDRLGRKIEPSATGRILFEKATQMLEFKKRACQELYEFMGIKRGGIMIGGSTIPGEYILPIHLSEFNKLYPGIRIQLIIGDTREIADRVCDGDVEIGIVGSKVDRTALTFKKLWNDELLLAVYPSHKWADRKTVSIKELVSEPFIIREPGSGTRSILENTIKQKFNVTLDSFNITGILGSSSAVKEAVKSGLGVSILSKYSIKCELKCNLI